MMHKNTREIKTTKEEKKAVIKKQKAMTTTLYCCIFPQPYRGRSKSRRLSTKKNMISEFFIYCEFKIFAKFKK